MSERLGAIEPSSLDSLAGQHELVRVLAEYCSRPRSADSVISPLVAEGLSHPSVPMAFEPPPMRPQNSTEGSGRHVLILEPHHDDAALSIGGILIGLSAHVTICTLFGDSWHVSEALRHPRPPTSGVVTRIRGAESANFARLLGAGHIPIGVSEAPWPWREPDPLRARRLEAEVRDAIDLKGVEVWGPAGWSLHPDHRETHTVAKLLGAEVFWEDVGSNGDYSSSKDELTLLRSAGRLPNIEWGVRDVTDQWHTKLLGLLAYASQFESLWHITSALRRSRALALAAGYRQGLLERTGRLA